MAKFSKRLIEWWIASVQRHPVAVLIFTAGISSAILVYSILNLRINVDMGGMISEKLRFRQLQSDFDKAFPSLSANIVVVIDGSTPDLAISGRERLAERLRSEVNTFSSVYEPGGGPFFEKNGLLYLNVDELQDHADIMAAAQPLIALLLPDLSLRGFFSVLEKMLDQPQEATLQGKRTAVLLNKLSGSFESAAQGRSCQFPWQEVMLGEKESANQRRQFIILKPRTENTGLESGEKVLNAIRNTAQELGITESNGIKVRITGDLALNEETMREVRNSVGIATLASLLLVAAVLYIGLGKSVRLIFSALITLLTGLICTTGFALAVIGSLNMISVTFAVLFIGLGIDYSIQFCLRYRELIRSGSPLQDSISISAKGVGRALLLSCVTTAIGFYSFIPTAYKGVAQLGLISGTGMFISFFANLTVLPALLVLIPLEKKKTGYDPSAPGLLISFPYRYASAICAIGLVLGAAAALLVPRMYFDYNPLNLYNPKSEPVIVIKELFKDTMAPPWTISVLKKDESSARMIAEKLRSLKEVKMVVTIFDFVPENQQEKLSIISNIALFMPPDLQKAKIKKLRYDQELRGLDRFEAALKKKLASSNGAANPAFSRLYDSIQQFRTVVGSPSKGEMAFEGLRNDLLSGLPDMFRRLAFSLQASPVSLQSLPPQLTSQYRAVDGRYRLQVFPRGNLMDRKELASFVESVSALAPDATDAPVTICGSGKAVISSFRHAVLYSLIAIFIVLLIAMRSVYMTFLILIPLFLAIVLTAASSVLLGIPLNFANVVVIPLLLGIGVHSGIIFILRHQTEPPAGGNMLRTSTSRAILFSSLTLTISTGSLALSSHKGISGMGILLTICFGLLILSVLVLLPSLVLISERRFGLKKRAVFYGKKNT